MIRQGVLAAVLALLSAGCPRETCPPPSSAPLLAGCAKDAQAPSPLPPEQDAGGASCSSACVRMRELHCKLGDPTPRGVKCEEFCETVRSEQVGAGFPVSCLAASTSCAEAERCR